jgi:hypothetical protein
MGKEYTDAQKRATYNYNNKHDRINCNFEAGTIDRIKNVGYSNLQLFIRQAVYKQLVELESLNK